MTHSYPPANPHYGGYGGYPPPPAPKNGFGTAGFVLGLLGLIFSPVPIVGVIAWPLVILGLILAIIGLNRAKKGDATNKGLAIAGIACSALGLLVCIIWVAAIGNAASETPTAAATPTTSYQYTGPLTSPAPAPVIPAAPAAPAQPAGPLTQFGEGFYRVGTKIEPGVYETNGASHCYWERLKDSTGGFDSIITNGNEKGPGEVTIKGSDYGFKVSGDCTWTKQ